MSMINRKCISRPKIINLNQDEPVFYPYSISVNKCSGSCNTINNPFAKLYVPDVVKNINVGAFSLMSRVNETRQIIWHETCKCICRLTSAVCNANQVWNEDKCRCECKLENNIDKLTCGKESMWNPSTCSCECDKLCDFGQYLDYKNCVCKNIVVDNIIEECTKVVNEVGEEVMRTDDCPSRVPWIVLFIIFLLISLLIGIIFVYYYRVRVVRANNKQDEQSDQNKTKKLYFVDF